MTANSTNSLLRPRTAVIHFGCRLNQFESDGLRAALAENAHELTEDLATADYVIINTCTVTNQADAKNRAAIRRAHRLNPQAKIIVTGCYATTDAEKLRSMAGVYRVVSNQDKHQIPALLAGASQVNGNRFAFSANHDFKSRATLKIQDGCNKSCSYCKIPQARGRGVSRNFAETVQAARELIAAGFGELVLTGINIGWYFDSGKDFCDLLETLLELEGNFHIRISSIEPGDVSDRLAQLFQHPKMARFLHVPVQSGAKRILRLMRRGYTPANFMARVELVRRHVPEIHIGTDIIVGFPGESEADFAETLALCRSAEFANIHIFPFSKRDNTPVADWLSRRNSSGQRPFLEEVHGNTIRRRVAELAQLKEELAYHYRRQVSGMRFAAVAERIQEGAIHFLTENYLRGKVATAQFPHLVRRQRFFLEI
ncbi:MAG: tRNA (N(6)-L-threonylcarbamoyladenosine(37)-C(2))-methylthiotransferase MtaB [Turneriella sp.]|nr:tRNA (N(6)-L-threonylcarbamoyladenosine(37)-C(2))-methylthiotransferase MtaB [Turneriella sp.]